MRKFAAGVLMAGLVSVSGSAFAQGAAPSPAPGAAPGVAITPEQVVAIRQSGMDMVGGITDLMKAGVASGADPKMYGETAAALGRWAKGWPSLFPDGTQTVGNTKAKAEIWTDRAGFEKADAAFETATAALVDATKSGDKTAFAAAFTQMGQTCGACHRNYKAR